MYNKTRYTYKELTFEQEQAKIDKLDKLINVRHDGAPKVGKHKHTKEFCECDAQYQPPFYKYQSMWCSQCGLELS